MNTPRTPRAASNEAGASPLGSCGDILWHFAARSLKLNRTRSIVSIIGIALSCALITAIFTSVVTLYGGLLKAEIVTDGTWQVELVNVPEDELDAVHADTRVQQSYDRVSYGDALMPKSFEGYWGRYLSVQEWPTADAVGDLKPLPTISEGRAPQAPDEIVLAAGLKGASVENGQWLYDSLPATGLDTSVPRATWDGALEVGSTIDLALGRRMFVDAESGVEIPCLYSETLYTTEGTQGDVITEYLADSTATRAFKVVGFFAPKDARSHDQWGSSGPGYLGFVSSPDLPVRQTSVYLTTNLTSRAAIDEFIGDYTGLDYALFNSGNRGDLENMTVTGQTVAYSHDALLRYQGMTDDRSIWGTLYTIAAILSTVVIVASISLIYNSFAIAVSERTRQFGLLSSLGASKRQLRRTVYAEALMLAGIGIPAGLAVGLAGTFVVFNVAGEGIGMLIDQEAFADMDLLSITVNPIVLAVCALLALVTVLVSAAIPAWRASRVSAVDAIRASRDVRLTRRERRGMRDKGRAARSGAHAHPIAQTLDGLRLRMGGVPALLSHRNLTRASSKGRVAVASLAVSVALIIISGGISHYLDFLTQAVDNGGSDIEVTLNRLLTDEETAADGIDAIDKAYQALSDVHGAHGEGYLIIASLYGSFEAGMIDDDSLPAGSEQYDTLGHGVTPDGAVYTPISILFLDDASWNQILDENGLDRNRYSDPGHPVAVGLNGTRSNDGRRYSVRDLFQTTGDAHLFTNIATAKDDYFVEIDVDDAGEPVAHYERYDSDSDARYDEDGTQIHQNITRPLDEVLASTYDLPVGEIVKTYPDSIKSYASIWPTLVLPVSALPVLAVDAEDVKTDLDTESLAAPFAFHSAEGPYGNAMSAYLSYGANDPRTAEAEMNTIIANDLSEPEWRSTYLTNNAEDVRTSRLMAETVQLFISCFILITSAIAVANVFNTLTNSIILRRREFAMLKSIGMGNRAFWRMIALECLSYAWRGLALGLALGGIATFSIYRAMTMSFAGLDFVVPTGWVIAAVAVVVLVLALSTVYALRKSRAESIVQTLREDAI